MFWRRGLQEDRAPLHRDGGVVLVVRVRRSSVSEQRECGMPVCHQVRSLELTGIEI